MAQAEQDASTDPKICERFSPDLDGPELASRRPLQTFGIQHYAIAASLVIVLGATLLPGLDRSGSEYMSPAATTATNVLRVVASDDPDAVSDAIAGLSLSLEERDQIDAEIALGDMSIGYLTLWDWSDEDGDVVSIDSGGYVQTVRIGEQPTTVVIPYAGPGQMLLTGLYDGGGGITVALGASDQGMRLHPLLVGDSVRVSVP